MTAEMPLPESATASTRCSGDGSSSGHDADPQARPGGRRAVVEPAAGREADLDRVAVAEVVRRRGLLVGPRRRRAASVGRARAPRWPAAARRGRSSTAARRRAAPPRAARPCGRACSTRLSTSTSATGTGPRISNVTRASSVPSRGSVRLQRAAQQRRRRARVLAAHVPRPGRVAGRAEAPAAERLVEGLAHRCLWNSASSSLECIAPIRSRSGSRPERMISTAASGSTSPDRRSTSTRTSSSTSGCSASR